MCFQDIDNRWKNTPLTQMTSKIKSVSLLAHQVRIHTIYYLPVQEKKIITLRVTFDDIVHNLTSTIYQFFESPTKFTFE